MLSHRLPDPLLREESATIIHAFSQGEYHYPAHVAPYLLVCNFGVDGDYTLNGEAIRANDRLFYFANAGDELEINFDRRGKRETLLLLFEGEMVKEAGQAWGKMPQDVLDFCWDGDRVAIPGIPFGFTDEFRKLLDGVRGICGADMPGGMAECCLEKVLAGFFQLYQGVHGMMARLQAVKAATREELFKRLILARALMEEYVEEPWTVGQIAKKAMLNRFYFIELFKTTFGVTPHQYLRRKKLERAHQLLTAGHPVTEVCHTVGFQSVGSFVNLFRKVYGCTPGSI